MKRLNQILPLALLLVAQEVAAQPFLLIDRGLASTGVEGGVLFSHGRVQPGFALGMYHPDQLNAFTPDIEGYVLAGLTINDRWYFIGNLGAGVNLTAAPSWSFRTAWVLTGTQPIAFRASVFTQWTPASNSLFLQARVGPSIRLAQTSFRIFPNLAVGIDVPGGGRPMSARLTPACLLILFF